MTAILERKSDFENEYGPPVHRWTRREVYALCDDGWFANQRVNLINGRIIAMPLPGPEHDYSLDCLIEFFKSLIPANCYVRTERAFAAGTFNDPGPDYAIVPGSHRDYVRTHPKASVFVAEVAHTTRRIDLKIKPKLYARASVPEYWVLDLQKRCLVVHREPAADAKGKVTGYTSIQTFAANQSVAALFAPMHPVLVESLLPPMSE